MQKTALLELCSFCVWRCLWQHVFLSKSAWPSLAILFPGVAHDSMTVKFGPFPGCGRCRQSRWKTSFWVWTQISQAIWCQGKEFSYHILALEVKPEPFAPLQWEHIPKSMLWRPDYCTLSNLRGLATGTISFAEFVKGELGCIWVLGRQWHRA